MSEYLRLQNLHLWNTWFARDDRWLGDGRGITDPGGDGVLHSGGAWYEARDEGLLGSPPLCRGITDPGGDGTLSGAWDEARDEGWLRNPNSGGRGISDPGDDGEEERRSEGAGIEEKGGDRPKTNDVRQPTIDIRKWQWHTPWHWCGKNKVE